MYKTLSTFTNACALLVKLYKFVTITTVTKEHTHTLTLGNTFNNPINTENLY